MTRLDLVDAVTTPYFGSRAERRQRQVEEVIAPIEALQVLERDRLHLLARHRLRGEAIAPSLWKGRSGRVPFLMYRSVKHRSRFLLSRRGCPLLRRGPRRAPARVRPSIGGEIVAAPGDVEVG